MKTADKVFLISSGAVALSTAGLPYVTGYGTRLFQLVLLGAWYLLAHLSSGMFADQHHAILYVVALFLNLVVFLVVAFPVWVLCRNRGPRSGSFVIASWVVLYLAMLFVLFPATDGP